MAKGSVTLGGHFPSGTKVRLFERVGDDFVRDTQGEPVATRTVGKDGETTFTDLDADGPYWVVGEIEGLPAPKAVRITAKADSPQASRKIRGKPARRVDSPVPGPSVVHGARSSASSRSRSKK